MKYIFTLTSHEARRDLPRKIIIVQQDTETATHVLLKLLGFVLFYRDRLAIESRLHLEMIPFVPDLIQLDFELRPKLWVECGECSVQKLDKLAVKVPEAEIWVIKKSAESARSLILAMEKDQLRTERYSILAFEQRLIDELIGLMQTRNELVLHGASFEERNMQFEFNGLWFDESFAVIRF